MKLGRMLKISLKAVAYASATLAMAAVVEGMTFKQRTRPKPRTILFGENTFESPYVGEPPYEKTMRALQELSESGNIVVQPLTTGNFAVFAVDGELFGEPDKPDALHAPFTLEQREITRLAKTHSFLDVNCRFSKPLGSMPATDGKHLLLEIETQSHMLLIPAADVVTINRDEGRVSLMWNCDNIEDLL